VTRRSQACQLRLRAAIAGVLAWLSVVTPEARAQTPAPVQSEESAPPSSSPPASSPPAAAETQAAPAGVTPPRLLQFVDAPYPKEALAAGLTADVLLRLRVEADGSVSEAEVLQPAGRGFDEAAVAAARQFKFEPAQRNGKPVAARIPFRYSFTLKEQSVERELPAPTTGNFHGRLQIAGPDTPLGGADVSVLDAAGTVHTARTDAEGSWQLDDLPPGNYQIQISATTLATPISRNSCGSVTPKDSSAATIKVPATMNAALSTLTAATTRARLSAPAQDCTAANDGTMNRPPAIARPARSIAMRMPLHEENTCATPAAAACVAP